MSRQIGRSPNPVRMLLAILAAGLMGIGAMGTAGCQSDAQTGGLAGAGIGALAGQAIGGNTEATLIGTAVGAGLGYIIGNEEDKKKASAASRQPTRPVSPPPASPPPAPAHSEVGPLGGTRWNLISLSPSDYYEPYTSKVVTFRRDGYVVTTTTEPGGVVTEETESYRVVGDTLIMNSPGYLVNARYRISGSQLIISAEEFSAVFDRLSY